MRLKKERKRKEDRKEKEEKIQLNLKRTFIKSP